MDSESHKEELFRKAGDLAHEIGAEAAVMIISGDGKNIYTLTTSDFMQKFVRCTETENRPALHYIRPEDETVEIDFTRDMARSLSKIQMGMLDVSISVMDLDELIAIENQLSDRLASILERKLQMMINIVEDKILQNEELNRQVSELQGRLELISSAVPYVGPRGNIASTSTSAADGSPGTASDVGSQVDESHPSDEDMDKKL